jgi:hypothetical protein
MNPREPSLESPIEQKISWAGSVLRSRKQDLLGDEKFTGSLLTLKQAVTRSRLEMARLGIGDLCRACEEREGGSCCGAGIENHYSASVLLLNLLLGVELPESRNDPSNCFFLSGSGCRLLARHVICVNYLCHRITSRISARKLATLREREGIELNLVFSLHEGIKKKLEGSSA